MTVTVSVPATSANLGPGFDALGVALGLENRFTARIAELPSIDVTGEGAEGLGRTPDSLAYRALERGYVLIKGSAPAFALRLDNRIPLARGLGSSSSAIIGGLLAGSALAGSPLPIADLVSEAAAIEGHPDNVAPAAYGGFAVAVTTGSGTVVAPIPIPPGLTAAVFVPDYHLETTKARAVLPASVPRADAVFNVGRTALLVTALLTNRLDLLRTGGEDKLHQPYRSALVADFDRLVAAAYQAGALFVALSGAGPSLLALTAASPDPILAGWRRADSTGRARVFALPIQQAGARLI